MHSVEIVKFLILEVIWVDIECLLSFYLFQEKIDIT